MSPTDFLLAAPFALLALAALPLPPLRRALLYLLHRGGHLTLFAGVVACGVFAYRPDLAPDPLGALLGSAAPDGSPAVAWVAKAALLLVFALPLLAHLDYAREVATHAAFLSGLRKERPAAPAESATRPHPAEVAAAVEAIRGAAGTARPAVPGPRKLVKDLLRDPR